MNDELIVDLTETDSSSKLSYLLGIVGVHYFVALLQCVGSGPLNSVISRR